MHGRAGAVASTDELSNVDADREIGRAVDLREGRIEFRREEPAVIMAAHLCRELPDLRGCAKGGRSTLAK
jgi:hypothetical protein